MGRYYYGDIKGKFFPAIQSSYDGVTLGGICSNNLFLYHPCGCQLVEGNNYCNDCFDSFDQAFENAISDGYIDEDANRELEDVLVYESDCIDITFEANKLEELQIHISQLYEKVGHYIKDFVIDKNDDYEYNINLIHNNIPEVQLEFISRWCLAKQIEQCIIDKGECVFECEL